MIDAIIYGLCNPSGTVFYIGVTSMSLKYRLSCHITNSKRYDYPVYRYILERRFTPTIIEIKRIKRKTRSGLMKEEKLVIQEYHANGVILMNNKFHPEKYSSTEKIYYAPISASTHRSLKVYSATTDTNMFEIVDKAVSNFMKQFPAFLHKQNKEQ